MGFGHRTQAPCIYPGFVHRGRTRQKHQDASEFDQLFSMGSVVGRARSSGSVRSASKSSPRSVTWRMRHGHICLPGPEHGRLSALSAEDEFDRECRWMALVGRHGGGEQDAVLVECQLIFGRHAPFSVRGSAEAAVDVVGGAGVDGAGEDGVGGAGLDDVARFAILGQEERAVL